MKTKFGVIVVLLVIGASALTAGCASRNPPKSASQFPPVGEDRLLQAAQEIKQEMRRMNQIAAPSVPPSQAQTEQAIPREFMRITSIDYDGDIDGFLRDLRSTGLYDVRVYGRRPAFDLPVSLHLYRQPMWRVLEDAGIQLGRFATIAIKSGVVMVNYVNQNQ